MSILIPSDRLNSSPLWIAILDTARFRLRRRTETKRLQSVFKGYNASAACRLNLITLLVLSWYAEYLTVNVQMEHMSRILGRRHHFPDEDHFGYVREILKILKGAGVSLTVAKCKFFTETVHIWGTLSDQERFLWTKREQQPAG